MLRLNGRKIIGEEPMSDSDTGKKLLRALCGIGYNPQDKWEQGGNGYVFFDLDKGVAIKVLYNTKRKSRFESEIQAAIKLQAKIPGIVPIIDVGDKLLLGKYPFFTMPYFRGGCLRLTGAPCADGGRGAVDIILAIARIVKELHEENYAHRDLKPDNVLCGDGGEFIIADLGLCIDLSEMPTERMTETGDVVGSLLYRPPEFLRGRLDKSDHRPADIFSLGRILWALLVGREPEHMTDLEFQQTYIDTLVPNLTRPVILREIIQDATAIDPAHRLNIFEFISALEDWKIEKTENNWQALEEGIRATSDLIEMVREKKRYEKQLKTKDAIRRFIDEVVNKKSGIILEWNKLVVGLLEGVTPGDSQLAQFFSYGNYPTDFPSGSLREPDEKYELRLNFGNIKILPLLVGRLLFRLNADESLDYELMAFYHSLSGITEMPSIRKQCRQFNIACKTQMENDINAMIIWLTGWSFLSNKKMHSPCKLQ